MNVFVLNKSYEIIASPDLFSSFIWNDRFAEAGEFELVVEPTLYNISIYQPDFYIINTDSEHCMIIESVEYESSSEDGSTLKVSGRSLESIPERRIVWGIKTFAAGIPIQTLIKDLLTEAIIAPGDNKRKISNFVFDGNGALEKEPKLKEDTEQSYGVQYTGDDLYSIITKLCKTYKLGFKVTLDDSYKMHFSLYSGVDRSYTNTTNEYFVSFSPEYHNVLSSNYLESVKPLKNAVLIGGEGEGTNKKWETVEAGKNTGMDRRELYYSSSASSKVGTTTMKDKDYRELLKEDGKEELSKDKYKIKKTFEGEMNTRELFIYGRDFFLGDIVQIGDGLGHDNRARITEIVFSYNTSDGYTVYPTFKILDNVDDVED